MFRRPVFALALGALLFAGLVLDYFGMHRIEDSEDVFFQLPYGEWIRLFRANWPTPRWLRPDGRAQHSKRLYVQAVEATVAERDPRMDC